jgi:DNA-binding XRE family transcriptional regulator
MSIRPFGSSKSRRSKNEMSTPTEHPTVTVEGRTYVMLPVEEYNRLVAASPRIPESPYIPFEVVTRHIDEGISKARAWREYLGLTQQQVAERMGISQAALSKLEKQQRPRRATLERLAQALGISVEQLRG